MPKEGHRRAEKCHSQKRFPRHAEARASGSTVAVEVGEARDHKSVWCPWPETSGGSSTPRPRGHRRGRVRSVKRPRPSSRRSPSRRSTCRGRRPEQSESLMCGARHHRAVAEVLWLPGVVVVGEPEERCRVCERVDKDLIPVVEARILCGGRTSAPTGNRHLQVQGLCLRDPNVGSHRKSVPGRSTRT